MGFLWNHWFWITLGLLGQVLGESRPFRIQEIKDISQNTKTGGHVEDEGELQLPVGARGAKILVIPNPPLAPHPPPLPQDAFRFGETLILRTRPSVSVSKSVSKVSVKMGNISEKKPRDQKFSRMSNLYTDAALQHRGAKIYSDSTAAQLRPNGGTGYHKPRRIDPQYIGYNLVYREPVVVKPTKKPPGLLHTIISKLKSLAKATTSRISLSSLLLGEDDLPPTSTETDEPDATTDPVPTRPFNSEEENAGNPDFETENPGDANIYLKLDDLRVTSENDEIATKPSTTAKPTTTITTTTTSTTTTTTTTTSTTTTTPPRPKTTPNPKADSKLLLELQQLDQVRQQIMQFEQNQPRSIEHKSESRPRSFGARGRSLPLHVLEDLEIARKSNSEKEKENEKTIVHVIQDVQFKKAGEPYVRIKEVESKEWEEIEENIEEITSIEKEEVESEQEMERTNARELGMDDIVVEAEKVDPANISALIGVVVGIIIFIIISIVLVLLGLQQAGMKKTGPAEDVISQSSYMTYSTTVSDNSNNSVNYGPNWDKDMIEDLCSLDNDSFLNSLEAVTTTDYWDRDSKY